MSESVTTVITDDLFGEIGAFLREKAWRYPAISALLQQAYTGQQVTVGPTFPRLDLRARSTTLVSASLPVITKENMAVLYSKELLRMEYSSDVLARDRERYLVPPEVDAVVTNHDSTDSTRYHYSWWKVTGESPVYTVGGEISPR